MNNQTQTIETDVELIGRTRRGDRAAAQRLTERHRRRVTQTAYQALGNVDDANDVAQETLMVALQTLSDLREPAKFPAWLRQLTLSRCIDYRRRRGTRRLGEPITMLNEVGEETDFAERLAVRQSIAHLSETHRTTLLLHYVGGWSLSEVAELLTVPLNTVRSRLMAAKRLLRADLHPLFEHSDQLSDQSSARSSDQIRKRNSMTATTFVLSRSHTDLLHAAFPNSRILSVQNDVEPWMPFSPRVRLSLADGSEREVDFRGDIDPTRAEVIAVLEREGIPGPRIVHGPVPNTEGGGYLSLCEVPRGENLLLWTLGGTPHRIRLGTERAFEAINRLQGATEVLLADPISAKLTRRTLTDEADLILDADRWNAEPWLAEASADIEKWRKDEWFLAALAKARAAAVAIHDPLVLTNQLHFFPNFLRIQPADSAFAEPLGWPGDPRYRENPIVEYVTPYGYIGDPLLELAMVWVYDCYPFVHTGFVEQFLWRRGVGRREFAPRLAIKAMQMIARDLSHERPTEGNYWDGLRGWVEQALSWL